MSRRDRDRTITVTPGDAGLAPDAGRRPVLMVLHGDAIGTTLPLEGAPILIGREPGCGLVLRDPAVSRAHARIERAPDGSTWLVDLGSTNGTLLNGTFVDGRARLKDDDRIRIGAHLLKLAWLDASEIDFQRRLQQRLEQDELTGLRSRRSLFADLEREVRRAAETSPPREIGVLMLDIDRFKSVNDRFGHLTGSQTVRAVGHVVRDCVGGAERAARYGGEEYLVWLEGDRAAATALAECIRSAVETQSFLTVPDEPERVIRLTISIGIAGFPADGVDALELVQRADRALYRAKRSGRNRVCGFDPELDRPAPGETDAEVRRLIEGPAEAQ